MTRPLTVLGIESSCDETAAAVVRGHPGGRGDILSNVVLTQLEEHAPYGGVVPEIAARAHIEHADQVVARALAEADLSLADLDGIAATAGPGLIGGVIVGLMTAKGIAAATGLPLVPVNHLEGHALTARMTDGIDFPYLLLLVSGGHSQLLIARGVGEFELLGSTIDDAVGEAFDKAAKLLGLGFPGGPAVERAAVAGNPRAFALPRPLKGREGFDFSFSGLKTALLHARNDLDVIDDSAKADLCASFQAAVCDSLADRTGRAMDAYLERTDASVPKLVVAGGVAANAAIRGTLDRLCKEKGFALVAPPPKLCTDNGAMIAWAGLERLSLAGSSGRMGSPLAAPPRARWPLSELEPA